MRAFRTMHGFRLRFVLGLLACALLVRVAVPSGWMLMPTADGGVALTLCSGMAPDAAMHAMPGMKGMAGKHAPRPDQPQPEHPCAFAGLALAAALPDALPAPLLPPVVRDSVLRALRTARVPGRGLAAPPPPPTGPPLLA